MLTAEQLAVRREGIGGSEMAALSGLSKRWRPIDVFRSKRRENIVIDEDDDDDMACEKGVFLEPAVRNWYAHRARCMVEEVGTIIHPHHRLVLATPDGLSHFPNGEQRALEIKCPHWSKRDDWAADRSMVEMAVPAYYVPQLIWEMAVLDVDKADMAVLLGDSIYTITVPWDGQMYDLLRQLAEQFWDNCVVPNIPPEPDESQSYQDYLRDAHPIAATPTLIPPSEQALGWARQLKSVEAEIKGMEGRQNHLKAQIKEFIGDHGGLDLGEGKISWRNNKDSEKIDYKALVAHLNPSPEIIAQFTQTKRGARVFRADLEKWQDR